MNIAGKLTGNGQDRLQVINEDEIDLEAEFESQKLSYDAFKHLTTLSTGSILLLATFLKDLFSKPVHKEFIFWIFLSFVVSVMGSVLMMFVVAYAVNNKGELNGKPSQITAGIGFTCSFIPFITGIILFVIFTLFNLNN